MNNDSRRVIYGGSWNAHARYARAAIRLANVRSTRDLGIGLRLSRRSL
jgi:formylglycine-generating enzyme required for sulfatase activity